MLVVIFDNRPQDFTAQGVHIFTVFNIEQNLVDSKLVIVHHILLKGIRDGGEKGSLGVEIAVAQIHYIGVAVSDADEIGRAHV